MLSGDEVYPDDVTSGVDGVTDTSSTDPGEDDGEPVETFASADPVPDDTIPAPVEEVGS